MLEDFFTLTEMKDGISTVARIGDLISEIQNLKNAVGLNKADMITQCSTAATTLASTKNEECLEHFVHLNGVSFLNQWLLDAQNCAGSGTSATEDLIIAILTAFECLPIKNEQSTSDGFMSTVRHLFAHGNVKINQKARALYQKWHFDANEACNTDQPKLPEASQEIKNDKRGGAGEVGNSVKESKAEVMSCSDAPLPDLSLRNDTTESTMRPPVLTSTSSSDGKCTLGDVNSLGSAPACHVGLETVSITKETSVSSDVALATTGMLPSDSYIDAKNGTGTDAAREVTTAPSSVEPNEPDNMFVRSKTDLDVNIVSTSLSIKESEPFSSDVLHSEKDTTETLNSLANRSRDLQHLSEESTGKEEAPTSSSSSDSMDMGSEFMLKRCMNSFRDSSKATQAKSTALKGNKSEQGSDYDDTDALEVARLVAIEVEREVKDYRGPFRGSPDISSRNADSPDLEAHQLPEPAVDERNDNKSSNTGIGSGSSLSLKEDGSGITDGSGPFSGKRKQSMDLGTFDLNENQFVEETDCNPKSVLSNSVNLSTPVAVAASRGLSMFPSRLHFEGGRGWKGSAATSAFRPASPRRTPDAEKSLSTSSHKTINMFFDLNVMDSGSATSGEPHSTADLPASSDIASKDVSGAVGVSGLKLDLNFSCGDEEDTVTARNVLPLWNGQHLDGNWCQPSSSSSSRQPAVRNFDLNDNMSITDGPARGTNGPFVKTSARDMSAHSSVTIMGKRIIVGQKEHGHQQQHSFLGPSAESRAPARSVQSYAHMPEYGFFSYPSQPAVPFPPAFYAPGGVPYMVDGKGAPVIPTLPGLGLGVPHPSFSTAATPHSSTESSYYHPGPSMGFNYGMPPPEGARREAGSYWAVPFQGQAIYVDERTRSMPQASSSELITKRKEPESGLDLFPRR